MSESKTDLPDKCICCLDLDKCILAIKERETYEAQIAEQIRSTNGGYY